MPRVLAFFLVLLLALLAVGAGVAVGSVPLPLAEVASALLGNASGPSADIVWKLRLPRTGAAFACGGLLALAGALLQALLRNPLADPYIFGVSGGAALGVLLGMLLGAGAALQTGLGLAGALGVSVLVFLLGFRGGEWNPYRLLLTGVVMAAGLNALLGLVLVLAPQAAVKGMLYWLMGDLSYAEGAGGVLLALGILAIVVLPLARTLNVVSLGRTRALSLGVPVAAVEVLLYVLAAVATLAAVLVGGTIGFVGLVVPHLVRLLGLADHRWLLPASMLAGGGLLVLADTLARSLWAPLQFPVGVLTALIGVPVLFLLLRKGRDAAH
ncbi:MAG TPA: iron ABC transporter permease [Burkholderiales bacterium]|nr:iron ABC transporter permease [Burkholderiales bacterium]